MDTLFCFSIVLWLLKTKTDPFNRFYIIQGMKIAPSTETRYIIFTFLTFNSLFNPFFFNTRNFMTSLGIESGVPTFRLISVH